MQTHVEKTERGTSRHSPQMPPGQLDTSALPQQPTDPRSSPPMANAAPQSTPSDDTRCHFFKLSLELRDEIYDYVAHEQTSVDLYVNLETPAGPKVYAYDEGRALSRTSSQIRTEYMARLLRRIKQLDIAHEPHLIPFSMPTHAFTTLMIAERKVSRNVWVQDNVAFRWTIPFEGTFDNGEQQSNLRLTIASDAVRAFGQKIDLPAELGPRASHADLIAAMTTLQRLKNVAELEVRNWWMPWWNAYQVRMLYCRFDADGNFLGQGAWIPGEFRMG